jgi:hypothetical protein
VDRIVTAAWRLRRVLAIETSVFEAYRAKDSPGANLLAWGVRFSVTMGIG